MLEETNAYTIYGFVSAVPATGMYKVGDTAFSLTRAAGKVFANIIGLQGAPTTLEKIERDTHIAPNSAKVHLSKIRAKLEDIFIAQNVSAKSLILTDKNVRTPGVKVSGTFPGTIRLNTVLIDAIADGSYSPEGEIRTEPVIFSSNPDVS